MRRIQAIIVGCLALLMLGCSSGPDPNAKKCKLEATGPPGTTLSGTITAGSVTTHSFDIKVPGATEFNAAAAQYTIVFNGVPKGVTWKLTVDGKEFHRGQEIIVEDDKGPRASFELKG